MLDTAKLARTGFLRRYAAGEIICRQGEPGTEMYIILQGEVEVVPGGGKPVILKSGDFFGETALLDRLPRSATVKAAAESVLLVLSEDNFKEVIGTEPLLALRIMKGMSARMRELDKELRQLKQAEAGENKKHSSPGNERSSSPEAQNYAGSDLPGEKEDIFQTGAPGKTGKSAPDTGSGKDLPAPVSSAAPVSQGGVLYTRKVTCPVCGSVFEVIVFMASKLRAAGQDPELRNRYAGFEPLLYSVWVCPECYYAALHDSFNQLNARQKTALQENAPARRRKFGALAPEGSLARAVQGCLLVLENLNQTGADPFLKARLWLRLAWLSDDAGSEQDARQARQNALALYEEAYFGSRKVLSPEQEQQMAYLIGELKYRLGDRKEALHFWRRAVTQQGGNAQFTRMVQDRIYDVRGQSRKKTT